MNNPTRYIDPNGAETFEPGQGGGQDNDVQTETIYSYRNEDGELVLIKKATNTGGSEGESLYIIGGSLNAAGFASGVGEYSNATNGMWKGANGKWYSTSWGGNQWTGARSKVMSKAGYFKVASRGFFYAGTLISGYQGFQAYQRGDYFGVAKSGLDITMGTIATFGGPPGLIIGGGYFLLDAFGTFDRTIMSTPYIQKMHAIPDKTYVAPSVNYP